MLGFDPSGIKGQRLIRKVWLSYGEQIYLSSDMMGACQLISESQAIKLQKPALQAAVPLSVLGNHWAL